MALACKTIKRAFYLWKSLLRQAWPIIIVASIIGSVYTGCPETP